MNSWFTMYFAVVHCWFTVGSLLVHCWFTMVLPHFADADRDCARDLWDLRDMWGM